MPKRYEDKIKERLFSEQQYISGTEAANMYPGVLNQIELDLFNKVRNDVQAEMAKNPLHPSEYFIEISYSLVRSGDRRRGFYAVDSKDGC